MVYVHTNYHCCTITSSTLLEAQRRQLVAAAIKMLPTDDVKIRTRGYHSLVPLQRPIHPSESATATGPNDCLWGIANRLPVGPLLLRDGLTVATACAVTAHANRHHCRWSRPTPFAIGEPNSDQGHSDHCARDQCSSDWTRMITAKLPGDCPYRWWWTVPPV